MSHIHLVSSKSLVGLTLLVYFLFLGIIRETNAQAPSNDLCANAENIVLVGSSAIVSGTTINAGNSDAPADCGINVENTGSGGVWYSFDGITSKRYIITTCSNDTDFDTEVSVFSGDCNSLFCRDGNDDRSCSSGVGASASTVYFNPPFTNQFLIYVTGNGSQVGNFELSITELDLPPNNLCGSAENIVLAGGSGSSLGTTLFATNAGTPAPCGPNVENSGSGGVWYTFTGSGTNLYEITTCSPNTNFDTELSVYTGSCGSFNCVDGNDDDVFCSLNQTFSTLRVNPALNTEYFVYVSGNQTEFGDFEIQINELDVPDNNLCQDAENIILVQGIGTASGALGNATDLGAPQSCNSSVDNTGSGGVWYTFTSSDDTQYLVTTCNSSTDFDTEISLYTGSCGSLVCVDSNDDADDCSSDASLSSIYFNSVLSDEYYIYLKGNELANGNYDLNVIDISDRAPIALCSDAIVRLDDTGNAQITGADIDAGSNDYGLSVSLAAFPNNFNCADVGPNTVTLIVTDSDGNSSSCTSTVTVKEIEWRDEQKLIGYDNANGEFFGDAVAVSADDLIVGKKEDDENGNLSGAVYFYSEDSNGDFVNPQKVLASDGTSNDRFGGAVDIFGTDAAVGAKEINAVYLYKKDAMGSWGSEQKITPSDGSPSDEFACDIALFGNYLAVGSLDNVGNGTSSGAVYVYEKDAMGVWGNEQKITPSDGMLNDDFGIAVGLYGDYLVVGSSRNDSNGGDSGAIYIYEKDAMGMWGNVQKITTSDGANFDYFGISVAIYDNYLIAGASGDDDSGNFSGSAYVYEKDAMGVWGNEQKLMASDGSNGDTFGRSVSIFGDYLVVNSIDDNDNGSNSGSAYVYEKDAMGIWTDEQKITASDGANDDRFSWSVDISGDNLVMGAPFHDDPALVSGSVYAYSLATSPCTSPCTLNLSCPPDKVVGTDPGLCQGTIDYLDPIVSSNDDATCSPVLTQTSGVTQGDIVSIGVYTLDFEASDSDGNMETCSFTITVEDREDPIISVFDQSFNTDQGLCEATVPFFSSSASDNCSSVSISYDPPNGSILPVGSTIVRVFATDVYGNTSTQDFTATVVDNETPEALCQDVTIQLDASNIASIVPADLDAGSTDNCEIVDLSVDITDFDCSNLGNNDVVLTVTDASGNSSSCDAIVTVQDIEAPEALCAPQFELLLDATGNVSITVADINNGSTDNCGIADLSIDISSFDCSDISENLVTLTVTDQGGNTDLCTTIVLVEDNSDPQALCQNISVQLDGSGSASIVASDIDAGSSDACGSVSLSVDISSFSCSDVGANIVELTAENTDGNIATCMSTVTIEDNIAPIALCQNISVQLDDAGLANIVSTDIEAGSTDACGIASLSVNMTDFDCSNIGANTVTLTVTDVNNNVSTCDAVVTVEDNVAPEALCQNVTVQLDIAGNGLATAAAVDNGSSDICGIASLVLSQTDFDCSNVGTNTVTLTVTDNSNNVSTCDAVVTVEDNEAPEALCQDIIVEIDTSGTGTIVAADVNNGSNDACGIADLSLDITTFDCSNAGDNTITLTVTDNNGNQGSCTANAQVNGLLCEWINDGGIGCDGNNNSSFDPSTDSFTLTSDDCSPSFPYISDSQSFIYQELCGDGYIKALVTNVNGNGFAGVEVRNSLDPNSKKIAIGTNKVNRIIRIARILEGYPAWPQEVFSLDKFWVKIERSGSYFRALASTDDINYIPYLFQVISMDECTKVGLFVYSKLPGTTVTADFTNVEVVEGTPFFEANANEVEMSTSITSTLNVGLSPNPAKDELRIDLQSLIAQDVSIRIYNINGQLMTNRQIDYVENATEIIAIDRFPAGTYYVHVKTAQQQQTLKLIKQ